MLLPAPSADVRRHPPSARTSHDQPTRPPHPLVASRAPAHVDSRVARSREACGERDRPPPRRWTCCWPTARAARCAASRPPGPGCAGLLPIARTARERSSGACGTCPASWGRSRSVDPRARPENGTAASATTPGAPTRCCAGSCRPTWPWAARVRALLADAHLDWRDRARLEFAVDNLVAAARAEQQPPHQPHRLEGADRLRRRQHRQGRAQPGHGPGRRAPGADDGPARRLRRSASTSPSPRARWCCEPRRSSSSSTPRRHRRCGPAR